MCSWEPMSNLFNSQFSLRLFENREIRDFADGNVAVKFQSLLCLFNHQAKSLFAHAAIVIVKLGYAFIGSRGHVSIDLQPLRYELNSAVPITANIAVGLDTRLDDPFDFIGLVLDFLHTGYQTCLGKGEDFESPDKNIKTSLLRFEIQGWRQ